MNQNFQNQSFQNKTRNRFPLMPNNGFGFQTPRGPSNNFIPMQPPQMPQGSIAPQFVNSSMAQPPFSLPPQIPPAIFPNQLHPFNPNLLPTITGANVQIYNTPQFGQPTTSLPMPHMVDTSKFSISQTQPIGSSGIMSEAEFYKYQEHLRKEKS